MLKGRGHDTRRVTSPLPAHATMRSPGLTSPTSGNSIMRSPGGSSTPGSHSVRSPGLITRPGQQQRALPARPEPDYEVVEFPSDQYVNAKLQPPPPPPPRPPTGHPAQAGASCGLCGGGGARVRCAECGRRALCASCDDMYHRHPKRRHHQRQALSLSQLGEDRPPLPPKGTPPVPPPRRHKMSASPMPPMTPNLDQRRATLGHGHATMSGLRVSASPTIQHQLQQPLHVQAKIVNNPSQMGSMPFLPSTITIPHQQPMQIQQTANTLGHLNAGWNRPRGSFQGFNVPQAQESWENPETILPSGMGQPQWGRPMRRGASTLELGGAVASCGGCAHCAPPTWRYGSCATLDQPWGVGQSGWPIQQCCSPQQPPHGHFHTHQHTPQTPQPYRRADSRAMSRAASRTGSRAASPALSVRSRASRRTKHRTPSPPLPSSDADSESESDTEPGPKLRNEHPNARSERPRSRSERPGSRSELAEEGTLGPVPSPPAAPWQCEHCTYVNEPGVRVCVICCRTPITAPKVVAEVASNIQKLNITSRSESPASERVRLPKAEQVSERPSTKTKKERTSTGCGPSPPREETVSKKLTQRLVTPTRDQNGSSSEQQTRHDMAVGPSPPREVRSNQNSAVGSSPSRETISINDSINEWSTPHRQEPIRASISTDTKQKVERHSVSVGPSPPRENTKQENVTGQKKSVGTSSPPRDVRLERHSSPIAGKTNVSNTGTSPPPQSISTQTYEEPSRYERPPSASRSRPRRRFRDDRRDRSHSRHSLSSDTRESDRSVRTTGAWEWRERDSSPSLGGGEWGGKLARRASHLDVRRRDVRPRHTSLYGSEAVSPEPGTGGRALSMEVLSGAGRGAERGLELARLLAEAERLGYSAAEVQVGLAQSPGAPLAWLRSRWAGLAGAVQGAAARLAPGARLSEAEARAALARHRGSVWPAVTECVDKLRRQSEPVEGRMRVRVWGSPAGADDDAAPRRGRAEDSSDEYDAPANQYLEDEWYPQIEADDGYEIEREIDLWREPTPPQPPTPFAPLAHDSREVALKLRSLLFEAGIPTIDEHLLLKGLLSSNAHTKPASELNPAKPTLDFIQSENDFIDAYNALTRASPLPNISKPNKDSEIGTISTQSNAKEEQIIKDDETQQPKVMDSHEKISHHHKHINHTSKLISHDTNHTKTDQVTGQEIQRPQFENKKAIQLNHSSNNETIHNQIEDTSVHHAYVDQKNPKDFTEPTTFQNTKQTDEKSSNLNEIVDNTQKLIQQMKEEINSDIHSLDDGQSQTSLSEHDTSSHDEQESSYSETDEETNKLSMTSDEKEMSSNSSNEQNDDIGVHRNSALFVNRASSEDNEQFEEALDNLDNQIEDVKIANIEILDSIARSLQEEHTISIEVNEINDNSLKAGNSRSRPLKENNVPMNSSHNISIVVNAPKEQNVKKEDSNNNLFVEVNSFEEIYEELNTSKVNKNLRPQNDTSHKTQKKNDVIETIPITPKILFVKHAINESVFKAVSPTRAVILNYKEPVYNAVIENIEIDNVNVSEYAAEIIHDVEIDSTQSIKVSQEIFDFEPADSSDDTSSSMTIKIDTINATATTEVESNSNGDTTATGAFSNVLELKALDPLVPIIQENKDLPQNQNTGQSNHNQSIQGSQNGEIIKQNSPEKILVNQTNNINKSLTSTVKSNIPKPVKTTPNKPKNDKTAPKLLVSKVPVRRGSLKQYHAPAPPKSHFGNVQSGHVKQLQSKIFNSKDIKPTKPQTAEVEAKPSTSTAVLSKKNPAPQPPGKHELEHQIIPSEEKRNNYFRETCRTEDEWTESDSDESQTLRQTSVEEIKPPSPPPPITLRRVSGNLIDLATVRLPEGSPERQARMLLAEGATETWEQAQLAVQLVSRGAALSPALLAALACADLTAALAYLHQDCELCASRLPEHEMVSMLRCTHRCCRECARLYFTVQITERSIADCVCPFCKMPDLEDLSEDAWLEYFAHLDIQLKTLLETHVHELFQRKLRDRTLAMDPNFKWCMECSSGFFVHPKQKKLRCPECRSVTCASCRKPWSSNHEGLSCEQYTTWLADNDPEISVAAVQQHLRENGLECPRCHFKYSLSRGGCMHFTCTQCKYEFCYGCGKPFTMGARCGLSEYCAKLGLHAHHPRNCLFYLRDKEPHELQTLLQMNNVPYETESMEGSNGRCPIPLQRETPTGLVDGICGSEAPPKHAGLCKNHYLEHLSRLVRARGADPLPLLAVDDLETLVKRAGLRLPPRPYGSLEGLYRRALTEIVKEKIPLD